MPRNPITIVALLIGIVEVAFAYPVTQLTGGLQAIVVTFMVSFPILLLSVFFLIVWFRPGHLYGPKDFEKDENFLKAILNFSERTPNRPEQQAIRLRGEKRMGQLVVSRGRKRVK